MDPAILLILLTALRIHHLPTYEHSLRVGRLVKRLASHLGLSIEAVLELECAAVLHDIESGAGRRMV